MKKHTEGYSKPLNLETFHDDVMEYSLEYELSHKKL